MVDLSDSGLNTILVFVAGILYAIVSTWIPVKGVKVGFVFSVCGNF